MLCEAGTLSLQRRKSSSFSRTVCEVPCAALPPKALEHMTLSGAQRRKHALGPRSLVRIHHCHLRCCPGRFGLGVRRREGLGEKERDGGVKKHWGSCNEHGRPRMGPVTDGRVQGAVRGAKALSCPGLAPASPTHLDGLGYQLCMGLCSGK